MVFKRAGLWLEADLTPQDTGTYGIKNPIIFNVRGTRLSKDVCTPIKILHPSYEEYFSPMSESQIKAWVKQAIKVEGYFGVALDNEGWTLKKQDILKWMYSEAKKYGGVFINVPKITLNHQMEAWKKSFKDVIKIMNQYTDAVAPWIYNFVGEQYLFAIGYYQQSGYKKPIMCMGDDGTRPEYGGITVEKAVGTVNYLSSKGKSFCVFLPIKEGGVIKAMRKQYGKA